MKSGSIILLIFTLLFSSKLHAQFGEQLFDDTYVHKIKINFTQENFWDTLTTRYSSKAYTMANINIDGTQIDSIGIRLKGQISYSYPGVKKPFKIKLNKFVKGKKYFGLENFKLNNGFDDPSMLREKLTYSAMTNAGIITPRFTWAKVYLNDTYWGLYGIVDDINGDFLKEYFGNKKGNLIETLDCGTLEYLGDDQSLYTQPNACPTYELKNNEDENDFSDFIHLLKIIKETPESEIIDSLDTNLNYVQFIKWLAVNVYLMNFDSYLALNGNGIYYHNTETDKFEIIPWDFNTSINGAPLQNSDGSGNFTASSYNAIPQNLLNKSIAKRIFQNETLKNLYLEEFRKIVNNNFNLTQIKADIDKYKALIRAAYDEDTNKMFTMQQFDENTEYGSVLNGWGESIPGLKKFFEERNQKIKGDLGITVRVEEQLNLPNNFVLEQNFPNPFNPTTKIKFTIPAMDAMIASATQLKVYDLIGKEVATLVDEQKAPGTYEVNFDASNLSSGVYFYKLISNSFTETKKLILLK